MVELLEVPVTTTHDWRARIMAFRWQRHSELTKADSLKCGLCWDTFSPNPEGAATFVDVNRSLLLRVCAECESLMPTTESALPAGQRASGKAPAGS
jgi:hypothetical protein